MENMKPEQLARLLVTELRTHGEGDEPFVMVDGHAYRGDDFSDESLDSVVVDDSRVNGRNTAVVPGVTLTRGHPLPPPHREVSSQPPPAAMAAVQAGGAAGSPDVSHGRQTSGGREPARR